MTKEEIHNVLEGFSKKHILLLGDIMLDAYVWGTVNRMSPEAPVPVLDVNKREERLGGMANVALNLRELGAQVTIVSVIGNDDAGHKITQLLRSIGIDTSCIVQSNHRKTTVKTRVISDNKHVIRIDEEQTNDISLPEEENVLENIQELIETNKPHCILFEDYNKGNLTESLIEKVIDSALFHEIPTAVDPKKKNFLSYKKVTLFKPNLKEIKEGLEIAVDPRSMESLQKADQVLRNALHHTMSLITLSEHGVYCSDTQKTHSYPAHKRNIIDVSGAGDTVIATASLALASGLTIENITFLSNLAGGLVCEKVGVVPISKKQLYEEACKLI